MQHSNTRRRAFAARFSGRLFLVVAGWIGLMIQPSFAGPEKHTVVHGNVTFIFNGNKTIIKASDGSIINFEKFNISPDESVKFIQPDELSRVLNRITGPDPSIIAGTLLSNGQVYIVNPAGVYFTDGAIVDVGGLYAAAGHLADQDFLDNVNRFTGLSGEVVNAGSIVGERVHLLGAHVANHGDIKASEGVIAMLAGDKILLKEHEGRIVVKVDGTKLTDLAAPLQGASAPDLQAMAGVENTGSLRAKHGTVVLGAGDMYALAIRNAGEIRARGGHVTAAAADGAIHNLGSIDVGATSGHAGSVEIVAPAIVQEGSIHADANDGHAGSITMLADSHTYLLDGSDVSASGGDGAASGGEIVIDTLNGITAMTSAATVSATGGDAGGDGGFAEISGELLLFNGSVELGAADGFDHGTLLLDPGTITVADIGADDSYLADGQITFDEPDFDTDLTISDEALEAVTGNIILQADDNIFINQQVDLIYANDVTMFANKAIVMNESINGAHDMTLIADCDNNNFGDLSLMSPLSITGDATFHGQTIFLAGHSLDSNGTQTYLSPVDLCVDMILSAPHLQFDGNVNATNPGLESLTINGQVNFDSEVGGQRALRSLEINGPASIGGGLVRTSDAQLYNGDVALNDDTEMSSLDGGLINFDASVNGGHDLIVNTAGTTQFRGNVGPSQSLQLLQTDAPGNTRLEDDMHAAAVDLNDPVTLDADVSIVAAQSVDFASSIAANGYNLDVASPLTAFHGAVTDVDQLHTDADGHTMIGSNISGDTLDFDDPVILEGDAILAAADLIDFDDTLDGGFNLTAMSGGNARFGGSVGSDDRLASLTVQAGGIIDFGGEFVGTLGDIQLNPSGVADVPDIATIAGTGGDLHFSSQSGSFIMGQHQKLTAMGDLTIDVPGAAQLGDLNSLGDMIIQASTIALLSREPAAVINSNGITKYDHGLDFVAGGSIHFSVVPTVVGDGPAPRFALAGDAGNVSDTLDNFDIVPFGVLSVSTMVYGETVLDLRAVPLLAEPPGSADPRSTPTRPSSLAEALGGASSRLGDRVPRDAFAMRAMERLAITMRSARPEELSAVPSGIELYDDSGARLEPRPRRNLILANRMRSESVASALERTEQIFFTDRATGLATDRDQSERIRMHFTHAWDSYSGATGAQATPRGFAAYLAESADHAEANGYVHELRALMCDVRIMGVTPLEYQITRDAVLGPLTPSSMQPEEFYHVIEGTEFELQE